MRILFSGVVAVMLAACVPAGVLQRDDPVQVREAAGRYDTVGACLVRLLGPHYSLENHTDPELQTMTIAAVVVLSRFGDLLWQVDVRQTAPDRVTVELRSAAPGEVFGQAAWPDVRDAIRRCIGQPGG
ncbi:MAG: hypothetical protein MI806_23235 [Minwuiales bacterium]|nr:hypothetical protein [Minwuiales bacterium]